MLGAIERVMCAIISLEKKKYFFDNCIVLMGFFTREIWVAFPGESQLRQSCATQPTVP